MTTKEDMPRLWLGEGKSLRFETNAYLEKYLGPATEYIRYDIHAAEVKALREALDLIIETAKEFPEDCVYVTIAREALKKNNNCA